VDALDRRHRGEPASRRAGAEADDGVSARIRMEQRRKDAAHDLRAGVEPRVPVALAVDDEREAVRVGDRDAALDALRFPDRGAAPRLLEVEEAVVPAAD